MTNSIVFSSTGNTKLLAQQVWCGINPEDNRFFGVTDDEAAVADTIYVGFWTNRGTCDDKTAEFLKKLKNKNVFLYGSAGFGSEEYFKSIIESVEKILDPSVKVIGTFMCQGKMKQTVRDRYEKNISDGNDVERNQMLLANFDKALTHPDNDDLKELLQKVKAVN